MSYKVKLTDTAKEDLRSVIYYIARQANDKRIAVDFVNELRAKTKILEDFPECGALPNDRVLKSAGYRFLVHKEYLIFYEYLSEEKTSYILAVFNSKRDYTRYMKRFL